MWHVARLIVTATKLACFRFFISLTRLRVTRKLPAKNDRKIESSTQKTPNSKKKQNIKIKIITYICLIKNII
jgi:hypothetical protein